MAVINRKNPRQESVAPRVRSSKRQRMRSPSPLPIDSPLSEAATEPLATHETAGTATKDGNTDVPTPALLDTAATSSPSLATEGAILPPATDAAHTIAVNHVVPVAASIAVDPTAVASAVPGGASADSDAAPQLIASPIPSVAGSEAHAQVSDEPTQLAVESSPPKMLVVTEAGAHAPATSALSTIPGAVSTPAQTKRVTAPLHIIVPGGARVQPAATVATSATGESATPAAAPDLAEGAFQIGQNQATGVPAGPPSNGMVVVPTAAASRAQTAADPKAPGAIQPVGPAAAPPVLLPAAAVQDPVPRPEVTFVDLDYAPPELIARLRNIVRYREVTSNRFALTMVPRSADWGRGPRTEKVLCVGGKPILIWLVGRVHSLWFFDRNGDPHLRVNLGFSLHSAEERAAADALFGRSRPRADSAPTTIYAGRLCSQRERGEYCHTATAFTQVYDATSRLTAKSAMPQLSPVELGKNDIVVVECNFTRWRPATEGKAKKSWSTFDVGFELISIFLLYSAPGDVPDGNGVEAADEITGEL